MREIWVHNTVARMLDNDENNLVSGRYLTVANMQEVAYSLLPTDTASGAVASFPDGAAGAPLVSLSANIDPVQDLHGYGSPWPAGGGKNLLGSRESKTYIPSSDSSFTFEKNTSQVTFTTSGLSASIGYRFTNIDLKCTLPAGTYYFSSNITNQNTGSGLFVFNADTSAILARARLEGGGSFTLSETATVRLGASLSINTVSGTYWFQLESGSTATAFAPYENICPISGWSAAGVNVNGETITHEFKDAQGNTLTVYGGKDELVGGKLKVTRGEIDSYAGESINEPWISSLDAYTPGGTPTTGAQVVYMLAVPREYNLPPVEVRALYGDNTIYADCGDVSVTYRADIGLYIDKKLASQNAALTNSMNNITVLDTVKAAFKKRG